MINNNILRQKLLTFLLRPTLLVIENLFLSIMYLLIFHKKIINISFLRQQVLSLVTIFTKSTNMLLK